MGNTLCLDGRSIFSQIQERFQRDVPKQAKAHMLLKFNNDLVVGGALKHCGTEIAAGAYEGQDQYRPTVWTIYIVCVHVWDMKWIGASKLPKPHRSITGYVFVCKGVYSAL